MNVYISIGNSDDRLTQAEWSAYVAGIRGVINAWTKTVHGAWLSAPDSRWQNACWCIELEDETYARDMRDALAKIRQHYRQDSVAWAAADTEFI